MSRWSRKEKAIIYPGLVIAVLIITGAIWIGSIWVVIKLIKLYC